MTARAEQVLATTHNFRKKGSLFVIDFKFLLQNAMKNESSLQLYLPPTSGDAQ
jgi:hypothetical protein